MSQAVGTIDPGFDASELSGSGYVHSGVPNLSVNGPWLDNTHNHHRNSPWRTFGKMSDAGPPSPSDLWVLLDEDANGLNDAAFAFEMVEPAWQDAPGSYHNGACGFALADGHSEIHKWLEKPQAQSDANDTDWNWLQQRTSAKVGSGT